MKFTLPENCTPLPWEVYEGYNFVKVCGLGYVEQVEKTCFLGGAVCDMDDWDGTSHFSSASHAKAVANAKLIVAISNLFPKLFDALQQADELDSGHTGSCSNANPCYNCKIHRQISTLLAEIKTEFPKRN